MYNLSKYATKIGKQRVRLPLIFDPVIRDLVL